MGVTGATTTAWAYSDGGRGRTREQGACKNRQRLADEKGDGATNLHHEVITPPDMRLSELNVQPALYPHRSPSPAHGNRRHHTRKRTPLRGGGAAAGYSLLTYRYITRKWQKLPAMTNTWNSS